jgi:hypothetical protein
MNRQCDHLGSSLCAVGKLCPLGKSDIGGSVRSFENLDKSQKSKAPAATRAMDATF